ncbi:MAG: Tad secretion system pilus assembly protein TadZ [Roseibaca calidilacus]|uniref:Pilus assembly protein CpaE n=1 Tax=Roseibaca calidilacus TaxID=1666912 RepID=A0A0P7WE43_9RHOB|nr:AAA family ATPase [Roseibaca calidilacus]KPP92379.1 MAG: Tad secretion system pilus assembly protein TadZ [Roseibaca calidilacus]CUX79674.1 pilus assembly protein CpaE [Roseibaca calidilacus]
MTAISPTNTDLIRACTVSRDVQNFDLLIEDMETEFGESWGDLTFAEAHAFMSEPDAGALEVIAIALDDADEPSVNIVRAIIEKAAARGIHILLIAEALSPILLHQLLRAGAEDFVPYPLPENALHEAIERLHKTDQAQVDYASAMAAPGGKHGSVLAVQALCGGAGATNFAINLGWELVQLSKSDSRSVCILDFDFQSGSVATYLDLARTEKVYELLSQTASMDADAFFAALQVFQDKLHVLTAPSDMLPLDLLSPEEIDRIVAMACAHFDYVIVDLPRAIMHWTETVLNMSDTFFALMELDMRSAQNTLRMIRALKADGIDLSKHRFVLNRAPKFTDLGGKSRAKRMAESLGIELNIYLPDGGLQVRDANDHGLPLAEFAAKNPLLKEIRKTATELHSVATATKMAAE